MTKGSPDNKKRPASYPPGPKVIWLHWVARPKLSENRANAVRNYLIEKGIAPGRITTIRYGRTKPAVYEVTPGDINTKEAKANMRVFFEVVVK